MPNPHVDGENGKKAIVYNTVEEKRGKEIWGLSSDSTRACPRILFVLI